MRRTTSLAFLSLFLAAALTPIAALPGAAFLEPHPGFADLGALPEPLELPNLKVAALLASGLAPQELASYESRLDGFIQALDAELGRNADQAAGAITGKMAEAVLIYLHKNVLRSYREDASTLDGILGSGYYNCVSSAVLYLIAARSLGIETSGARTSDHAFCTVLVAGRVVDVETTNPYGFDPGGKKEFKDSFGRVTGYAYVAPGGYGDRKAIGGRELIGLILSNRASMLERSGGFAEAAKIGADYAALCPGADSRAFQIDRIGNLVADLESRRDYAAAEAAARAAAAALPGDSRLTALSETATYNRAAALESAGDWKAAFDAAVLLASGDGAAALVSSSLAALAQDYARKGDFAGARAAVAERSTRAGLAAAAGALATVGEIELVRAANGLPFAQAAAVADRVLAAGEVSAARYSQVIAAIYGNEAARIGEGGDWLGAAALAEKGGLKAKGDGSLARLARTMRLNFVAEAHNSFARLYNAGDYAGAKAALTAALAALPDEAALKSDLAAANAALAR
jgi:hypothetical protein